MSDLVLPPDFDPEQYLEELEAILQAAKNPPLDQRWHEALRVVRTEEEQQHCSAEEFAREMGL